jgi:hypothetical protein
VRQVLFTEIVVGAETVRGLEIGADIVCTGTGATTAGDTLCKQINKATVNKMFNFDILALKLMHQHLTQISTL